MVAVELNVTDVPPKKTAMTGVRRLKWPVALTVTVFPIAGAVLQVGEQVRVISVGLTVITEPLDSRIPRQMTMFVFWSQGWPATYEVGVWAAWNDASRATLAIVTRA